MMGRLKNTSTDNIYGGGKEQLYISDSGKTYRIRNSSTDNIYGGGKEKIINMCPYHTDKVEELVRKILDGAFPEA